MPPAPLTRPGGGQGPEKGLGSRRGPADRCPDRPCAAAPCWRRPRLSEPVPWWAGAAPGRRQACASVAWALPALTAPSLPRCPGAGGVSRLHCLGPVRAPDACWPQHPAPAYSEPLGPPLLAGALERGVSLQAWGPQWQLRGVSSVGAWPRAVACARGIAMVRTVLGWCPARLTQPQLVGHMSCAWPQVALGCSLCAWCWDPGTLGPGVLSRLFPEWWTPSQVVDDGTYGTPAPLPCPGAGTAPLSQRGDGQTPHAGLRCST